MLKNKRIGVKILKIILKKESMEEKVNKWIMQLLKIREIESVKNKNGFKTRLEKDEFWKSHKQKMLVVTESEKIMIEIKIKGFSPEQRARPM